MSYQVKIIPCCYDNVLNATKLNRSQTYNDDIFNRRVDKYNLRQGARVGDYLKDANGLYKRFGHYWSPEITDTPHGTLQPENGVGSYFLGDGFISMSGSLDHWIDIDILEQLDETVMGDVWFFRNNEAKGGNGIHYKMPFRVFKIGRKKRKSFR